MDYSGQVIHNPQTQKTIIFVKTTADTDGTLLRPLTMSSASCCGCVLAVTVICPLTSSPYVTRRPERGMSCKLAKLC
jgi:hypothetical protein